MLRVVGRCVSVVFVLSLLSASPLLAADSLSSPALRTMVPGAMQLAPEILARVQEMLTMSETFRAQVRRLGEQPHLVISASLDPKIVARSYRARSIIRRYSTGLIVVSMTIAPGPNLDEFIAHEFEHVLEQLEGLDLTDMARRGRPGVWFSGPGMIETSRATRAGRAVTDEMRGHGPRSDNLVQ